MDPDSIHALPVEAELTGRRVTLHPAAVVTPRGLLLVDVGPPGGVDGLADALADAGLALGDTWAVVVTHQDADHAGCLAAVVDRTAAAVFAHEADAPHVEGEREPIKSTDERPLDFPGAPVDVRLTGGETFRTDAGPLRVVHTPGHTPGHLSLHAPAPGLLLAADAVNAADGELVGPLEPATLDLETAWESVADLAGLDVERTLCYHGGYVDAGTDDIRALARDR
jgi:glyoxylase-like metal-dependent hydrolase (beta-lactamase superfamily II)